MDDEDGDEEAEEEEEVRPNFISCPREAGPEKPEKFPKPEALEEEPKADKPELELDGAVAPSALPAAPAEEDAGLELELALEPEPF